MEACCCEISGQWPVVSNSAARYAEKMIVRASIVIVLVSALAACSQNKPVQAGAPEPKPAGATQPATQPAPPPPAPSSAAANTAPALHVDANRVMQYTREIIAFGPRYDGSKAIEKVRQYLLAHLKGDQVEQDSFVAETPAGKLPMTNIIAKFPGTKDGIIVLASHYETNYNLRNINYVGTNDGACTSALLLEIANQLRGKKLDGYSVWLVWDDGEESVSGQWSDADSLYGTKHLAQKWQQDGAIPKIKALFIVDMLGDKDLKVLRDTNSTPWLEDLVYQAASAYGFQSHFFTMTGAEEDDHLPFARMGVPVADLISTPYGYNDAYHHTVEDTLDKISVRSLKITGDTLLEAIRLVNQR
jgi:glutaminyl-peptide cyclotransferase